MEATTYTCWIYYKVYSNLTKISKTTKPHVAVWLCIYIVPWGRHEERVQQQQQYGYKYDKLLVWVPVDGYKALSLKKMSIILNTSNQYGLTKHMYV